MKTKVAISVLNEFDQLPNSQHVRLPVVKALLGVSTATIYRLIEAKKLKSYKLTERTLSFKVSDLREFLASKIGADHE